MTMTIFSNEAKPGFMSYARIVDKLDERMGRRDYAGAERHLRYWLEEMLALDDRRGELAVRNELVGHFRKTGNRDEAIEQGEAVLALVDELDFGNTISAATTCVNVATAFCAFGKSDRALELFARAARIYEGSSQTEAHLLGGLYNNWALACVACGRFDEADELYGRALSMMEQVENGELERAITYLNLADAISARAGEADVVGENFEPVWQDDLAVREERIGRCLDTALELLNTPSVPRDGYYAFVCEKCAPVFGHYGYFLVDEDLRERAKAIYERA